MPKAPDPHAILALAEYRRGHWDDGGIAAVDNQSMALEKGGQAADWFLAALIHARKGEKEIARTWFDKAVERARPRISKKSTCKCCGTRAATLLGQPGPETPPAADATPRSDPASVDRVGASRQLSPSYPPAPSISQNVKASQF